MRQFSSQSSFETPRGTVFVVAADREMSRDKPEIIGESVEIDGRVYRVAGIERHMPFNPIGEGEKIGLLVTDDADTERVGRFVAYGGTEHPDPKPSNRLGFFHTPAGADRAMQRFMESTPLASGEFRWSMGIDAETGEDWSRFASR